MHKKYNERKTPIHFGVKRFWWKAKGQTDIFRLVHLVVNWKLKKLLTYRPHTSNTDKDKVKEKKAPKYFGSRLLHMDFVVVPAKQSAT